MDNIIRRPANGTFELTGRCNLACKMCLVRIDPSYLKTSGLRERSAREWIDMADQAANAGTIGLLLTGGEVTLRPDFPEIYEHIARMGFLLTVYTNATNMTREVQAVLDRYPPHKIGITMYGASNETYQKVAASPRGYDRFMEGFHYLKTLPSLLEVRTTLIQDNVADYRRMQEMVDEEMNRHVPLKISRFVMKGIRGACSHAEEVRLTPEQNAELIYPWIDFLKSKGEDFQVADHQKFNLPSLNPRHQMPQEGEYLFHNCEAGINQYTITWSGRMYACEVLNRGYTEPFEVGFDEAWSKLPDQYPRTKNNKKCIECKYSSLCEACPAYRLAESGDWFGISEYSCREAICAFEHLHKHNII